MFGSADYDAGSNMVIQPIAADETLKRLLKGMKRRGGAVSVSGLWGASARLVAAMTAGETQRTFLYITAHLDEADAARDELELFADRACQILPAWEALPGEGMGSGEIEAERVRLCSQLLGAPAVGTIVAPIQALMQPLPSAAVLERNSLSLRVGDTRDLSELSAWLADRGFSRLDRVEAPGDYAVRGDIVDIFNPGDTAPVRLDWFDDRIESIRRFDVSSQRSQETLEVVSIIVPPHRQKLDLEEGASLFDYLPSDAVVVLDEPAEIQEFGRTFHARLSEPEALEPVTGVLARAAQFDQMQLTHFGGGGDGKDAFSFEVTSASRFEGKTEAALQELCDVLSNHQVYVFCDNEAERERLSEIVDERLGEIPDTLHMPIGLLHRGFEWVPTSTICIGHHELFHRYAQRRRIRRVHAGRPLESWLDLEPGDLVVHVAHGIARYVGMQSLAKGAEGKREEFLTLEFAERAKLHVPTSQIDLVQKYIGAAQVRPKLSKLGGNRWKRTTEKVEEAVSDLASALLDVQAAREMNEGTAYPADTRWQREFEGSFVYEETEDQLVVNDEIKRDLQFKRPADRLLCGDVGFGKTELAIRAAFKVVEYGKQVAVLVPTTVLAEQHYNTFRERLADFPFQMACLSRFRSPKEQKQIVEDLRRGRVDIVVGTHRLLSKDVRFADLGLVVIDEEQRFGVEHKNRLRELRTTVDVLTMTATPIPRTLHMSMLGIRDISSLATPPLDRRSIATQIRPYDPELVREAILREMNRDGQVYFIHNIVQSIYGMADEIRCTVPEARVLVGHGQMKEGELEKVMGSFVRHEADVLVATTIIESGIDIPRVNTIFINNADRFGLADLHQLRGRVGRSHHRAYCYLLLPRGRTVTPKAARRLKSIEEFSELGAGFRIAMRDLEIRGAGNILGPEQSGHIAAVGYEMYCQILERTVRRLQGLADGEPPRVQLELGVKGYIPSGYITSERSRIDVYKRMASCRTMAELRQTEQDLQDAFGKPPKPAVRLLELAEVRVRAGQLGVRSIVLQEPDVVFTVEDHRRLESFFSAAPGTARMPDARTIHWRLPGQYLESGTLLAVLRRHLASEVEVPT